MSFQNKYLKYKNKYLYLKKQIGGTYRQLPGYERPENQRCTLCQENLDDAEEEDYYKCKSCNQCMHIECYDGLPVGNIFRQRCPICQLQNWVDLPFPSPIQPPLQLPHQLPVQTLGVNNNFDPVLGHTGDVNSVAVIGDRIISCSDDSTIKIWTLNQQGQYTCTQTLGVEYNYNPALGHTGYVNSVTVDGDRIVSGGRDHTIKIWTLNQQGQYTCTQKLGVNDNSYHGLGHTGNVNSVTVDGDRIVSGSNDRTIKIWTLNQQGQYTCTQTLGVHDNRNPELGHTSYINSVVVHGDRIISCSCDHTIKIWKRNQQGQYTCTQTLGVEYTYNPALGHTGYVNSVTVDGDRIVSVSNDRTIKIWKRNQQGQYTCTQTLGVKRNNDPALGHTDVVKSVVVDGDRIISCSDDSTIKIWTLNQQGQYTCTHTLVVNRNDDPALGHTGNVNSLAVIGDRIVSGSDDTTIKIWDRMKYTDYPVD